MAIVTIGTQTWDDQNLDVDSFGDGTPIVQASSSQQWIDCCAAGTPAWRYYEDKSANSTTYGRLYNWYVVSASITSRNIVENPQFKVPTAVEYNTMINYLGGTRAAGFAMKNTENWGTLTRISGNGSNSSGWEGNPGGFTSTGGEFFDLTWSGNWWSTTTSSVDNATAYKLYWQNRSAISVETPKTMGLSIRLIASGSWTGSGGFRPSENWG
jgi:uncharacterized protein (TIGR02145 family)